MDIDKNLVDSLYIISESEITTLRHGLLIKSEIRFNVFCLVVKFKENSFFDKNNNVIEEKILFKTGSEKKIWQMAEDYLNKFNCKLIACYGDSETIVTKENFDSNLYERLSNNLESFSNVSSRPKSIFKNESAGVMELFWKNSKSIYLNFCYFFMLLFSFIMILSPSPFKIVFSVVIGIVFLVYTFISKGHGENYIKVDKDYFFYKKPILFFFGLVQKVPLKELKFIKENYIESSNLTVFTKKKMINVEFPNTMEGDSHFDLFSFVKNSIYKFISSNK